MAPRPATPLETEIRYLLQQFFLQTESRSHFSSSQMKRKPNKTYLLRQQKQLTSQLNVGSISPDLPIFSYKHGTIPKD